MNSDRTSTRGRLREYTAEEIRVLLARKRMSAAELARRTGIKQSTLARRMTGEVAFDLDDLEAVADVLGVPVMELLPTSADGAKEHLPDINHSTDPGRVSAPYSRHTASAPGPMSPQRRDATRPQSSVPATKRRPTTLRSPSRPMAA